MRCTSVASEVYVNGSADLCRVQLLVTKDSVRLRRIHQTCSAPDAAEERRKAVTHQDTLLNGKSHSFQGRLTEFLP